MQASTWLILVIVLDPALNFIFCSAGTHEFVHMHTWWTKSYLIGDSTIDLLLLSIVRVIIVTSLLLHLYRKYHEREQLVPLIGHENYARLSNSCPEILDRMIQASKEAQLKEPLLEMSYSSESIPTAGGSLNRIGDGRDSRLLSFMEEDEFKEKKSQHPAMGPDGIIMSDVAIFATVTDRKDKKRKEKEEEKLMKGQFHLTLYQRRSLLALTIISWLFGVTKGLVRLVKGTPHDDATPIAWFWVSQLAGPLVALFQYLAFSKYAAVMFPPFTETENEEDDEATKKKKRNAGMQRASFWTLVQFCQPDWYIFLAAFLALSVAAAGNSVLPFLYGRIIDAISLDQDVDKFHTYMLYLVLTAATTGIFSGIRGSLFILGGARFAVRIRQKLFDSLLRQDIGFFDTNKTGEITSRLSADCQKVSDQVELNVNVAMRSVFQAIFTLIFMLYINWQLALTAFISVPAMVFVAKVFGQYMEKLTKATQDVLADSNSVAEECISSMTTTRSFAAEQESSKRYQQELLAYYTLLKKKCLAYAFYAASTFSFLPYATTAMVLYYGGELVTDHEVKNGELVSFVFYLQSLFASFNSLAWVFNGFVQAVGASDKVFEWINREPEITTPATSATSQNKPDCDGDLKLVDVKFNYPSRPKKRVLKKLNIHVKPGEVVALCGESGGGKSSVVKLFEHFYEPLSGEVLLDDEPIKDLDPAWLHRQIAMVGQEPVLSARSIRENIVFGFLGQGDDVKIPSREEVIEAAKKANAHDFIMKLPDGYDTDVGERGTQLSGGQKQRIAIARALVRKPRVLLLDEATSALDAESEHVVQEAIDKMIAEGNMTVVVIAHRLSTIKNADKIVVINNGRVVEQGNHDELLQNEDGHYARLVNRQMTTSTYEEQQRRRSRSRSRSPSASICRSSDEDGQAPVDGLASDRKEAKYNYDE